MYVLLPTINKSTYSDSLEFLSSATNEFYEGILSCCLVVEDLLLHETVEILGKKMVVKERFGEAYDTISEWLISRFSAISYFALFNFNNSRMSATLFIFKVLISI